MNEQEATELIATKLMHAGKITENGLVGYRFGSKHGDGVIFNWNPFTDSNHARMVKDEIYSKGLGAKYIQALMYCLWPVNRPSMHLMLLEDFFELHNAPDDVCMWAVVDVLEEVEK